ncbi:hypothetical protein [Hyphomicrobium sp.]|uniref:hypothetical protein n=1 Tax=Hyphomicrobium sp. TaxID=82 RepID=UPI002E36007D|nr:hypothetical protein [Hyphomicrobium sp.]HEX2841196.1 hypothetical protein [Hyphomicrobium sp.]
MNVSGYSPDELELFRKVLDRAVAEAALEVPVDLMARRLFMVAQTGERDPDKLFAAVLGRSFSIPLWRASLGSYPPPLPPAHT